MAFTSTVGYTWVDGEVVTAIKLNLAAAPTIPNNQSYGFADGTTAAPSISFNSESTLGLYRYGSATLGLAGSLNAINSGANTQLQFGQDATHNLNMLWTYNATAGNAAAVLGTFSKNNDLTIQAKNLNFDTSSLAFALQLVAAGRAIFGGAADDGSNQLQTSTFAATGLITPSQTAGIKGTTTNNDANAGSVGEYTSSTVAVGSGLALTSTTALTVTSISLTAGDWDVSGLVSFTAPSAENTTLIEGGISTTNNALNGIDSGGDFYLPVAGGNGADYANPTPVRRLSLSSTTTIYLVARATFNNPGVTAAGTIRGRRVR